MAVYLVFLVLGCGLLYFGGDWLVDGIQECAAHLRVSAVIVAFVVMGFGTSAPELFVAIDASLAGKPDIVMGNVVGSNIANLMLVLSVSAILAPLVIDRAVLRIDGAAMIVATLALVIVAYDGVVSRPDALILMVAMVAYVSLRWRTCVEDKDECTSNGTLPKALVLSLAGLAALPIGAHLFVDGAVGIARQLDISETIIGLTVVALGTSLPELAACVAASLRNQSDVIIGGIVGSNVFNSTVVIGGGALALPVAVNTAMVEWWMPAMLIVSVATLVFMRTGLLLSRREGCFLIAGYVFVFVLG